MIVIVVMMQLAKRIPFEDPDVLMMVRGLYVASNLIILGVHLYTQSKINAKKGTFQETVLFLLHLVIAPRLTTKPSPGLQI